MTQSVKLDFLINEIIKIHEETANTYTFSLNNSKTHNSIKVDIDARYEQMKLNSQINHLIQSMVSECDYFGEGLYIKTTLLNTHGELFNINSTITVGESVMYHRIEKLNYT